MLETSGASRRIAVVGAGYVGLVSAACLAEVGNEVRVHDIDSLKIDRLRRMDLPIHEPDLLPMLAGNLEKGRLRFTDDLGEAVGWAEIILFTVNTPALPAGDADLTSIRGAVREAARRMNGPKLFVVKSTVPVGVCRVLQRLADEQTGEAGWRARVVANPEFLREGSAIADCFSMDRIIIGTDDDEAAAEVEALYRPFGGRVIQTGWESAEMIKYASNIFLAMKISFINEIANVCDLTGADVLSVADGIGADRRIGRAFLNAGIGYGGSCFPKDTEAMLQLARRHGYEFRLLRETIAVNRSQREIVLRKLEKALGTLNGATVAVLGLTFKPCTNDMREAPSLWILTELAARGARVAAFDPVIRSGEELRGAGNAELCATLPEACRGADACLVLTEWTEIVNADWTAVGMTMNKRIAVDGRNCLDPEMMRQAGFRLFGVGRPPKPQRKKPIKEGRSRERNGPVLLR